MSPQLANPPRGYNATPSLAAASFKLSADPGTDLWRKPPMTNRFSSPILYYKLPLTSLRHARLSLKSKWQTLYDQGGLCLILPQGQGEVLETSRWVKTGIEFTHGAPHISTVSCDRSADWSLSPLEGDQVTVEMERETKGDEKTSTLWIYAKGADGVRRPVREITWVFENAESQQSPQEECWVGAYVAKPTKDADGADRQLEVEFWDMAIETWEGPVTL